MPEDLWRLKLRFWGVRGSIPTPEPQNMRYGGNTSCVEVREPGGEALVVDAGTGIRLLGLAMKGEAPVHIFFSHFHWDHIQGLPFFSPLYNPNCPVVLYSTVYSGPLRETLEGQMSRPYFPVDLTLVSSKLCFVDLGADPVRLGGVTLRPFPLNHPQGCGGYRIERAGAAIVYATDREHGHAALDATLLEFAKDADILIHDSQYTPDEYTRYKGWGHSTWEHAVEVAKACNVKQLVLFHHDPNHDDATMMTIVEQARRKFANTVAAREGEVITV
jgi:phosphoribosyl 1,2-cyclic phosphodiesterase